MFCLSEGGGTERCLRMRLHTLLACGQGVWFAAQTQRDSLAPFHALICPAAHVGNVTQIDQAVWEEIRDVKKCFRLMLEQRPAALAARVQLWNRAAATRVAGAAEDYAQESESDDAEERLLQQILAEHASREHLTAHQVAPAPATQRTAPRAKKRERRVPVFFEFHMPRRHDIDLPPGVPGTAHYTVDCLAVTESEMHALKMALVNEFKMIKAEKEEINFSAPETQTRSIKELSSKTFLRDALPRTKRVPPYLYFDFDLQEALLLVLAPGDMSKKSVIDLVRKCVTSTAAPSAEFDYNDYLEEFKTLYSDFDCFKAAGEADVAPV